MYSTWSLKISSLLRISIDWFVQRPDQLKAVIISNNNNNNNNPPPQQVIFNINKNISA